MLLDIARNARKKISSKVYISSHAQWCHSKSGESDTRAVPVHHEYNSLQHSKGRVTWHQTYVSLNPHFVQRPTTYNSMWWGVFGQGV